MDSKLLAIVAVLALLCTITHATAVLSSYDQPCGGSNPACVAGLVCDAASGKCTQPAGICDNIARTYVPSPPIVTSNNPTIGNASQQITEAGTSGGILGSSSGFFKAGWFSDWPVSGAIGIAIAIAIIAIAAMFGIGFNLPEVKAFANAEISQAIISALLLLALLIAVAGMDQLSSLAIQSAHLPIQCTGGEPCYITASTYYLQTLYDTANEGARMELSQAIENQAAASYGSNLQTNFWYLGFAGTSIRINAGKSIEAERAGAVFDTLSKLMVSIEAQKYFIYVISYGIAPLFLLLGLLLRTFFFTRKLGGLLLAIAIALFIVYPLTYVFSWFTLNVTVYGERSFAPSSDPACPAECTAPYPVAFFVNATDGHLYQFSSVSDLLQAGINDSNWDNGGSSGAYGGLVSCRNLSSAYGDSDETQYPTNMKDSCSGCPDYCRDVPFPSSMPGCNITKCSTCNAGCRIMRQRTDCATQCTCDASCKTGLPVENKCVVDPATLAVTPANLSASCGGCEGCPQWCKFINGATGGLVNSNEPACNIAACKTPADGGTCPSQCEYKQMASGGTDCTAMCNGCPQYCRVKNVSNYNVDNFACNTAECAACPDSCKIDIPSPPQSPVACAPYPTVAAENCVDCPVYCRVNSNSFYNFVQIIGSNVSMSPGTEMGCLPDSTKMQSHCSGGLGCTSLTQATCTSPCTWTQTATPCSASSLCPTTQDAIICGQNSWGGCCSLQPTSVATVCNPAEVNGINCNSSACGATCFAQSTPPINANCLAYAGNGQPVETCGQDALRDDVNHTCAQYAGGQPISDLFACNDATNSACVATRRGVQGCCARSGGNTGSCQITGNVMANAWCAMNGASCSSVPVSFDPGDKTDCTGITVPLAAGSPAPAYPGLTTVTGSDCCAWQAAMDCYGTTGGQNCQLYDSSQADCALHSGCSWLQEGSAYGVPITQHDPQYTSTANCAQCPENCRIKYADGTVYDGGCGVDDSNHIYTDCSAAACPSSCRMQVNSPPAYPQCIADSTSSAACTGCSALCRINASILPAGCSPTCQQSNPFGASCPDSCKIPAPSTKVCEDCFNCEYDCIYQPAVRTDCSELCTDEALAGPTSTAPDDFVKKLPGATGEVDVRNAGVLMVPALVMPLFCIVIVIAFVRILSPLLGGDIEIPGLGRII